MFNCTTYANIKRPYYDILGLAVFYLHIEKPTSNGKTKHVYVKVDMNKKQAFALHISDGTTLHKYNPLQWISFLGSSYASFLRYHPANNGRFGRHTGSTKKDISGNVIAHKCKFTTERQFQKAELHYLLTQSDLIAGLPVNQYKP